MHDKIVLHEAPKINISFLSYLETTVLRSFWFFFFFNTVIFHLSNKNKQKFRTKCTFSHVVLFGVTMHLLSAIFVCVSIHFSKIVNMGGERRCWSLSQT